MAAAGNLGNHTLQVVLVEDGLYYMGSNGYPDHEAVMRDMIPTASGTTINLMPGEWNTTVLDFVVPEPIIVENARLVVFVQHPSTKDVLNAYSVPVLSMLQECDNEIGDLIDYGSITVQDLVLMVGIIMGTAGEQEYCTLKAADVNEDGQTNIQDVVLLVEMILS